MALPGRSREPAVGAASGTTASTRVSATHALSMVHLMSLYALRLLLLLSAVLLTTNGHGQSRSPEASLDAVLRPYLSHYDLPAIAAAIVIRGPETLRKLHFRIRYTHLPAG